MEQEAITFNVIAVIKKCAPDQQPALKKAYRGYRQIDPVKPPVIACGILGGKKSDREEEKKG